MKKRSYYWLLAGFFVAVAIYFAVDLVGLPLRPFAVALPVFYLSLIIMLFGRREQIWLSLGLLFSAGGDIAGGLNMFLIQVGLFAAAHICYIVFFLKGAWFRPGSLLASVGIIIVAVLLGYRIIPGIEITEEKIIVIGYIAVICLMCITAFFWRGRSRAWYAAGALMFILSDALIAWNKYVTPIEQSSLYVMITYFSAQFIFAATYLSGFIKKGLFR